MVPPFDPLAYKAAEACGRLPLVLAVAGGILAEAGGQLTKDFVDLLLEDHACFCAAPGIGVARVPRSASKHDAVS